MAIKQLSNEEKTMFTLQWHLTTKCPNNCKHCYIDKNGRMLSYSESKKVIDDFKNLLKSLKCSGRINFSGGDPLMCPYFFKLLKYSRERIPGLRMGILGNPELLTEKRIKELASVKLYAYQVSIDGLEETHDYLRYKGSFKKTIKKIRVLKKMAPGIKVVVMTTISKKNATEIAKIIDLVVREKVDVFGFKRFVPIGKGRTIEREAIFSPKEFRGVIERASRRYEKYKDKPIFFGKGEPLWKLYEKEQGIFSPSNFDKNLIWGGCGIGICSLSILETGEVLACRRLPITIGKVPSQKLKEIFISSKKLNCLREEKNLKKCKDCDLLPFCRGCRAMAHAACGDYFAPDPQCWK